MSRDSSIRGVVVVAVEFFLIAAGAYFCAYFFTYQFAPDVAAQFGGFWATTAAIFTMHFNRTETYSRGFSRLLGVLVGAAVAGGASFFLPFSVYLVGGVATVSVVICQFAFEGRYSRLAALSAVAVMLGTQIDVGVDPLQNALFRVVEAAIGAVVSVIVAFLAEAISKQLSSFDA